ncbi:DUF624 domain-containing protein [Gracilibacillus oryzae]|uniref:DUF624 domain-containing protein n=1 Tax=Gracilibacillus oryzae TaxID=1672701 RepID=A0A7C8KN12_9BACI|nr:DUF624 domain-containing protein [Gracilibacillus oryzae]KAB8127046.1 DUF624 domain-containing protein [Gracilibacillus oryzae]
MKQSGIMFEFNRFSEEIFKFLFANLLWVLFNLPIIIISFNLLIVEEPSGLIPVIALIVLLLPFVFFPSTAAVFGVIRKFKMKEDILLVKTFWQKYKENYVKSMVGGFIIVFIASVLIVDYFFLINFINMSFHFLLIILLSLLIVFTLNFFSIIVHIDLKTLALLRHSLLFTFANPVQTIRIALFFLVFVYVCSQFFVLLIPFYLGSIIAYHSFHVFWIRYTKIRQQGSVASI